MTPTTAHPAWLAPLPLPGNPAGVTAAHTMRGAVKARDPYSGFNVCHYVGDNPAHVAHSRRELACALNVGVERLVVPRQTHSTAVAVIDRLPVDPAMIESVDAVVTRLRGVAIGVNTADCVPVVMADTEAGVIGALHAGWRGALAGITANAVAAMVSLGADPANIIAAMGPCICAHCFEVGEEVAEQFPEAMVTRPTGAKPRVDLAEFVATRLEDSGLSRINIALPKLCTRCDPHRLFSARALGTASGRIFTAIVMP